MTLRLKKRTNKIRNIKLVHDDDENYCDFMTNIQLEHYHLRPSNQRLYADIVGYPLEKTVREWAKESGAEALSFSNYSLIIKTSITISL